VLSRSRDIQFIKRIESLIKIAGIKFEFKNFEIRFHKRQVSFLVIKTVKCKRGISVSKMCELANLRCEKFIILQ